MPKYILMKLKIIKAVKNYIPERSLEKSPNIWKLNNTLLSNPGVYESKEEVLKLNENQNIVKMVGCT